MSAVHLSTSFRRSLERWDAQGCEISHAILNGFTTTEQLDYVTIRDGLMSFFPAHPERVQQFTDDGKWKRDGRQDGKPGRILRRFLLPDMLATFSDKEIEDFGNRVKADQVSEDGGLTLVVGDDIAHWYDGETYAPDQYTLNNSCMRYGEDAYFRVYTDNPDRVAMLIRTNDDGQLLGRAIVWTADDGATVMDRVYGTDVTVSAFREHATAQGWWVRGYNSYDANCWYVNPATGSGEYRSWTITLRNMPESHQSWPWLDTFCYVNLDADLLTNDSDAFHTHVARETGGYLSRCEDDEPDVYAYCENCEDDIVDVDDAYYDADTGRTLCESCFLALPHCYGCDTRSSGLDVSEGPDGETYCESCYAERWTDCDDCGEALAIDSEELTTIDAGSYCDACIGAHATRCDACDAWVDDDDCESFDTDGAPIAVCNTCMAEHRPACPCGVLNFRNDFTDGLCHWCYVTANPVCVTCYERSPRSTMFIADGLGYDRCATCERARLTAMIATLTARYTARRVAAGQLALAAA